MLSWTLGRVTRLIGVSNAFAENLWQQNGCLYLATAQPFNFQASARRDPESPITPPADRSLADTQFLGERGATIAIDKVSESFHGHQFSYPEPETQAFSLILQNPEAPSLGHTSGMNITWQSKAKARMIALSLTQNHIAEVLDVSKGTVSNWFSGRHQPPLAKLRRLAQVIDISFAELIAEDDAICHNLWELEILRALREIPLEHQDQASLLVTTLAKTLAALPLPPPPLVKSNTKY